MAGLVFTLALLAALGVVAARRVLAGLEKKRREKAISERPGYSPDRPVKIARYSPSAQTDEGLPVNRSFWATAFAVAGLAGMGATAATTAKIEPVSQAAREPARPQRQSSLGETFNDIYASGTWGMDASGKGTSGSGSTVAITAGYRVWLEDFLKKNKITSVVDAGCGDWTFSSAVNWNGARYLGVDISSDTIAADKRRHEKGKVRFQVGDVTESLPAADLLVCKDVLQHLSNELVAKFIKNNIRKGKYKWALITNDRRPGNRDIAPGGHRGIDLSASPFEVKGLVDLPIKFGNETSKVAQLVDLR